MVAPEILNKHTLRSVGMEAFVANNVLLLNVPFPLSRGMICAGDLHLQCESRMRPLQGLSAILLINFNDDSSGL